MTTREERINNPNQHDSAEYFSRDIKGAEFYENNEVENVAKETSEKVRFISEEKPKIGTLSRVKYEYKKAKNGFKSDVNNIVNGVKNVFSKKKQVNADKIIKDLNNSNISFNNYEKTMIKYIKENDDKWGGEKAWQNERGRVTKELALVRAKEAKFTTENENLNEVYKIEKDFKNDSTEQLYDRLARSGHDKKDNFAEACINILYNRSELQLDNPQLWKALEKLSNDKISFEDAKNLNSREISEKVRSAVELIWSAELTRKWGIVKSNGEVADAKNKKESRIIRMDKFAEKGGEHDDFWSFYNELSDEAKKIFDSNKEFLSDDNKKELLILLIKQKNDKTFGTKDSQADIGKIINSENNSHSLAA